MVVEENLVADPVGEAGETGAEEWEQKGRLARAEDWEHGTYRKGEEGAWVGRVDRE